MLVALFLSVKVRKTFMSPDSRTQAVIVLRGSFCPREKTTPESSRFLLPVSLPCPVLLPATLYPRLLESKALFVF